MRPDETEEHWFNRVVTPWLGSRKAFDVSYGIKESHAADPRSLADRAVAYGFLLIHDDAHSPESLQISISPNYEELRRADQAAEDICRECGYVYVCRSFLIEREQN